MFGEDQYVVYTVQSGDTLNKISSMFGVSVADIAKANMIADINKIEVGQQLMIPEVYSSPNTVPTSAGTQQVLNTALQIMTPKVTTTLPTTGIMQGPVGLTQSTSTGILSGTMFGIPKVAAYGLIALLTAGVAIFAIKKKKAKITSTGTSTA